MGMTEEQRRNTIALIVALVLIAIIALIVICQDLNYTHPKKYKTSGMNM